MPTPQRLMDWPVLEAEGQKLPLPSIVVAEIKRPMRKDATEDKKSDPTVPRLREKDPRRWRRYRNGETDPADPGTAGLLLRHR